MQIQLPQTVYIAHCVSPVVAALLRVDRLAMTPFTGTWEITSSPHFDRDYLQREGSPYVRLRQQGDRIEGEYQFGAQRGHIDGRPDGKERVIFSFEGMDDEDLVNGAGTAAVQQQRLVLTLMCHFGDDYTVEAQKIAPSSPENRMDDG